ncbi:hypothetical protein [Saccharopolyspora gregorii]|uniref:hypothetical protein n=1 Tax=Saccharopolyspora gregorii TaxID=33914 RepID=UPI0031E55D5C
MQELLQRGTAVRVDRALLPEPLAEDLLHLVEERAATGPVCRVTPIGAESRTARLPASPSGPSSCTPCSASLSWWRWFSGWW